MVNKVEYERDAGIGQYADPVTGIGCAGLAVSSIFSRDEYVRSTGKRLIDPGNATLDQGIQSRLRLSRRMRE